MNISKLSEAETEVMYEIWGINAPVTVARVLDIFSARRGWKTSTLSTIMDRLIDKGFLSKSLVGKINYYTANFTEEVYKEHETEIFMKEIHKGSVKSFIAAFAHSANISDEEIAEIRAWFLQQAGDDV